MTEFRKKVLLHYKKYRRPMPWRDNTDPYCIFVSEIMLQQTQVSRVVPRFQQFIHTFPDVQSLATATFQDVLRQWSGLGYNRRAKFLWQSAQKIVVEHGGKIPKNRSDLESLPGIGPNTAGAILVYAHNKPEVFIETNIRSVFLHHFFANQNNIDDKTILPLIQKTMLKENPREWYWALMDYGAHLKTIHPNPSRASKHHIKQSKFEGSDRQLRGEVLRVLLEKPLSRAELSERINDKRLQRILTGLQREELINVTEARVELST